MRFRTALTFLALAALAGTALATERDRDGNPRLGGVNTVPSERPSEAEGGGATVFSDPVLFADAAGSLATEDFEDEPLLGDCISGGVSMLSTSDLFINSSEASLKILQAVCNNGNHGTTPAGSKFLSSDTDNADLSGNLMFVLPGLVQAFGFWITDADTVGMRATVNGQDYQAVPIAGHGDGGETFFGVIDPAGFSTVLLTTDAIDSHFSVDDVSYGSLGPVTIDPDTWANVKSAYR